MKILYAASKYSPLRHDDGSGDDYNLYHAFLREGAEVEFIGPFTDQPGLLERVYRKAHNLFSRRRFAKHSLQYLQLCGTEVTRAANQHQPDIIFSHFLAPLLKARVDCPIAYLSDAPIKESNDQWPLFSRLETYRMMQWERAVARKSAVIFTRSQWVKDALVNRHAIPPERIHIIPIVSALPFEVVPEKLEITPPDFSTIHLLLVGRVYQLKGIDIGIQICDQLNAAGVPAELRVVGLEGDSTDHVRFMGLYKKADPLQLAEYASHYRWAHFLLHPARYDAAAIVTAEAAAFGVPTITNAVGGLATTVRDGVSGIVLPRHSPPEEYVRVIREYLANPQAYQQLRQSTRQRYEDELNWRVVGRLIVQILTQVVQQAKG